MTPSYKWSVHVESESTTFVALSRFPLREGACVMPKPKKESALLDVPPVPATISVINPRDPSSQSFAPDRSWRAGERLKRRLRAFYSGEDRSA